MGPNNVLMGESSGIDLPQMPVDEKDLAEIKNKAKYSKSKEYKDLKRDWEERIKFYQTHLPDGRIITDITDTKTLGEMWLVANCIIAEIKTKILDYDLAEEIADGLQT